ncbi:unnamed protein product [Plutella xylostella]|uniref:(diamondback moth) hypothetical protein n=1 Tax=Plutella xylostella TaxID=51655 RepID=A0A8S4GE11_PLUXY|nr:unnamed protein product [Plutella xylostella]
MRRVERVAPGRKAGGCRARNNRKFLEKQKQMRSVPTCRYLLVQAADEMRSVATCRHLPVQAADEVSSYIQISLSTCGAWRAWRRGARRAAAAPGTIYRKFLEKQKQMRVLNNELFGEPLTTGKRFNSSYAKGRRNIRKVLDKKSLQRSTVVANMEEFERKKRLHMKQNRLVRDYTLFIVSFLKHLQLSCPY